MKRRENRITKRERNKKYDLTKKEKRKEIKETKEKQVRYKSVRRGK